MDEGIPTGHEERDKRGEERGEQRENRAEQRGDR
jgi:hypothetical protein